MGHREDREERAEAARALVARVRRRAQFSMDMPPVADVSANDIIYRSMHNLLESFAANPGKLTRDVEMSDGVSGRMVLNNYNTLLQPTGYALEMAGRQLVIVDRKTGQAATFEQSGIGLRKNSGAGRGQEVEISFSPEAYMRLSAAWGYDASRKLDRQYAGRWQEIRENTALYEPKPRAASPQR